MPSFEISSIIEGSMKDLSEDLLCMDGVNYELLPLAKMTVPSEWTKKPLNSWPLNTHIFTSTILLFGFLPVDLHKFKLKKASESGFSETSSSLVNKEWNHQRKISPVNGACEVRDLVEYIPKVKFLGAAMKPVYKVIFAHRHQRLRAKYKAIS